MRRSSNSSTQFRQMSAPRIRSAARLDDSPDRHRNFSATALKKWRPDTANPETPKHVKYYDEPSTQMGMTNSAQFMPQRVREVESPVKRMAEQPPPATKKQIQYGRKLQYPQSRPEQRFQRQVSVDKTEEQKFKPFSSQHFGSRSEKSIKIKADQEQYDHKFKKALEYVMSTNKKFFAERSRLCCQKAKPYQINYNLPQAGVLTTYKQHYPPKTRHLDGHFYPEPQNKKQAFGLPDGKVTGDTTYQRYHDGRYGPRADLAEWPEGFKLQGPIDGTTTYNNHYPNYGDFDKMVPIAVWDKAPTGLPFHGDSDHRRSYKDPKGEPAQLATWNNMHPYGNDFDPNRGTTYGTMHGAKTRQPIQNWPLDPFEESLKSPGKFDTEYRQEYPDKNGWPINKSNKCPC